MRLASFPILAGVSLALFLTPAWGKAILVYPKDGTAVSEATITLLGAVEAAGQVPQISLGGQALSPAVQPNGLFSLSVRLQPGLNVFEAEGRTVRVEFLGKGQPLPIGFIERYLHPPVLEDCGNCHGLSKPGDFSVAEKGAALCLSCHDDPTLGKDKKPQAVVHSPIADGGDCLSCHDPHVGDTKGMNVKPLPALCYECHDQVTGKAHDHAPAAAGDCTSCHDPHAAPFARLVRQKGQGLCLSCHKDPTADPKQPQKNLPFLHGGLDEGCLACHDPHGSAQKGGLRKQQVALCWDCHDQGQGGDKKGVTVHSPIRDDKECTVCHLPHAGTLPKLLTEAVPALCNECHEGADKPAKAGDKVHGPVASGACVACHSPHAGPGKLLARKETELCVTCHPKMPPIPGGSNHAPVSEGECLSCHLGHSGGKGLLRKKPPALCADCHDDVTKKADGKPFALIHPPVEEGACLDCHSHHFSPNPGLLKGRGNALCLTCHDDPGLTPEGALWPTVHPPVVKDCLSCHFPHASDQKGILKGPVFELCSGCHRAHPAHTLNAEKYLEERKGSMVTLPEDFPLTPSGKMACTGCHLPHGGKQRALLKVQRENLCQMCHPK